MRDGKKSHLFFLDYKYSENSDNFNMVDCWTNLNFQNILSTMLPDYTTQVLEYSKNSENSDNWDLLGRLLNKSKFSKYSVDYLTWLYNTNIRLF